VTEAELDDVFISGPHGSRPRVAAPHHEGPFAYSDLILRSARTRAGRAVARPSRMVQMKRASRRMAQEQPFPRCDAPGLIQETCRPERAWGMPGAKRTRSLACKSKKAHELVTTSTPETRHSRTRMVLTAYGALSLVSRALLSPSPARSYLADLISASGYQAHTTSPSASSAFVLRAKASIASRLTFVTMANAPLSGETGEALGLICPSRLGKNLVV
jgi:hypothetical protein